ncbi:ATP-binding cassette domain-containing protein, partial [Candidatus Bipolaricaulota bacterium]|nr:ATP-binding cassette domain-containing protein [Candidatus Bipolaricaulota bacterium]
NQYPNRISGGEQQRVAVARAVIAEPSIVLADEPTANLDTTTSHELIDLMRRLNSERGATFLFATHDSRLLDRVSGLITIVDGLITGDKEDLV